MTVPLKGKWNCEGLFRTLQKISDGAFEDLLPNISYEKGAIGGVL